MIDNEKCAWILRDLLSTRRLTINQLDDGTGVALDMAGENILVLNEVAMRILAVFNEEATLDEAARAVSLEFDVDFERARMDICRFAEKLTNQIKMP